MRVAKILLVPIGPVAWGLLVVALGVGCVGCVGRRQEIPPDVAGALVFEHNSEVWLLEFPGGRLLSLSVTKDAEVIGGDVSALSRCQGRASVFVEVRAKKMRRPSGRFVEIDLGGEVQAEFPYKHRPEVSLDCLRVAYQHERQMAVGTLHGREPLVVFSAAVSSGTGAHWIDTGHVVFQDLRGSILVGDAESGELEEIFPDGNWYLAGVDEGKLVLFEAREFSIWIGNLETGSVEKVSEPSWRSRRLPVVSIGERE